MDLTPTYCKPLSESNNKSEQFIMVDKPGKKKNPETKIKSQEKIIIKFEPIHCILIILLIIATAITCGILLIFGKQASLTYSILG